jgi:L-threonylcarbamoyladenylate synthase
MQLLNTTNENINFASEIIKNGGLVAFPTETVYGLGADGLNPIAVAKIYEAKQRPTFNPLILHISDKEQLKEIAVFNNKIIELLIDKFWPGPLTLVLPKKENIPDIVTAGHPTAAVRMPNHKVALELIKQSERPIAAPSANVFGHLSPTNASHVIIQLKDRIDLIIDGGDCAVGVESTILQFIDNKFTLLRPGGLPVEKIETLIGKIDIKEFKTDSPIAPGMLPYHYAPKIPLKILTEENIELNKNKRIGVLFFKEKKYEINFASEKILSKTGNLRESAANLFHHLHEFEKEKIDIILAEQVEEHGLGRAIMDRLRKASEKFK